MKSSDSKINLIISQFIKASVRQKKQYNPHEVSKQILSWTKSNPQLTKNICRCLLKYPKAIPPERENVVVEQLLTNYLLKRKNGKEILENKQKTNHYQRTNNTPVTNEEISSNLSSESNGIERDGNDREIDRADRDASLLSIQSQNGIEILAQNRDLNETKAFSTSNVRENTRATEKKQLNIKWNRNLFFILFLLGLFGGGFWLRKKILANDVTLDNRVYAEQFCTDIEQKINNDRKSLGEKNLILNSPYFAQIRFSEAFIHGIDNFANCDFDRAATDFEKALGINKNNPEIVIYLNNARAATKPNLRIAVSVPIGTKREVAEEILRGVAQAQTEINQEGGIEGKLLSVEINNDDNDPETAKEIAVRLVQQPEILAVVGHNTSSASVAASTIYQQEGLVMISPTSATSDLTGAGDYIFRTVPNVKALASSLVDYAVSSARLTNIAFCYDSDGASSRSFVREFSGAIADKGGKLIDVGCDFSATNFDPDRVLENLTLETEALLLLPSVPTLSQAIAVAKVNQNQLPILGNHSLHTFETIEEGQANVEGAVLAVPWHSDSVPDSSFPQAARNMWGGNVNWRTAMAYDATLAIVQGLQKSATRQGLQAALSNRRFAVNGATGKFSFENSDRQSEVLLVEIQQPRDSPSDDYQFIPVETDN